MVAQRLEHKVTDKGYVPVYATGVVEQPWSDYSSTDHAVWAQLYARQREVLPGRACDEFLAAMAAMQMDSGKIPRFDELNEHLWRATPSGGARVSGHLVDPFAGTAGLSE